MVWGALCGAVQQVPSGPAIVVSDTFTRGDSAVTLGNAETGQAWTAHAGTWGISSNQAYSTLTGADAYASVESGLNDGTFEATIKAASWTQNGPGLTFRQLDASNFLLASLYDGFIYLYKVSGGAFVEIGAVASATANGTGYSVRAVCNGALVLVYVAGVLKISYTMTGAALTQFTGAGYTRVGFRQSDAVQGSRFDNLQVTA